MVYCGKPSKGCGQCRTRKIRCDQARPACSQCTRARRECPGYRDELSLMFRDESNSVVRKAKAESSASPASSAAASRRRHAPSRSPRTASPEQNSNASPSTADPTLPLADSEEITALSVTDAGIEFDFNSDPQHQFLMQQLRQSPLMIQPTLEPSKEEAISYFLQSHAIPGTFMSAAVANFLMKDGGSVSQKAMQSSLVAVACALLSRIRKVKSLRQAARQEYGSALQLVNTALADAEEAKTNQALGAVILLSAYELVTSRTTQGIEGWSNHIRGAAALLELRGTKQLETFIGMRLFMHLRYQIILSCIQRDVRVPESLMQSTKLVIYLQPKDALGNRLIMIIGNLSNLRADIHAKAITNPKDVLSAACAIEADLIAWLAALPPEFTYTSHTMTPLNRAFERRCRGILPYNNEYHVYPELWVCNCWANYRCARILVSEIILSHVHKLSASSPNNSLSEDFRLHCKSLRATTSRLGADICRSVPFHLGACNAEIPADAPTMPPESYLGGLMLLWPLFLAGMVEGPTHPQRQWVVKCLSMIGHTMGLDQALAIMDILSADPGMFHSPEIYGDAADPPTGSAGLLPFSVFHVPHYHLITREEYREYRELRPSAE
ncbi:hypothetical protein N7474_004805 [Penicillium riverlandense]|uniref:uncharacterized protein n=1 Tax=Penicillium riverlandense TaxID=1903569 RepID=UPI0025476D15|nr:uncharacterized protein N7474_004805 [Penicillium riverlandense]KAJ5819214.1 hypothetical protein N7474_004805 [Penicillium riverlandense]